jgi:hypothetical protein
VVPAKDEVALNSFRCSTFALRAAADTSSFGAASFATRVCVSAVAILVGGSSSAFACPVCFGAEETHLIDGAKLGILVLLGVTLAVQGAFVAFFLYLRQRAKQIADIDLDSEWSELQGGASKP